MRHLVALAFALFLSPVFACDDKTPGGVPTVTDMNVITICRSAFVIQYSADCKAPYLAAEKLTPADIGGTEPRLTFKPDPIIVKNLSASKSDYAKSGYDMGHLAPAADFKNNTLETKESFYLTNAVPQAPRLNRGTWRSLEIRARALAVKQGEVFVITGAIYSKPSVTIGSGVCVPDRMYKIIIDLKNQQGIAYLMPNQNSALAFGNYVTTVAEVERASGIDMLPKLDRDVAKKIRSSVGPDLVRAK